MDGIRMVREAQQSLAAKGVGLPSNQPTGTLSNQYARGNQGEIFAMPVDPSQWQAIQVLDPASADFGKFYFLPDYDIPGDETKVYL